MSLATSFAISVIKTFNNSPALARSNVEKLHGGPREIMESLRGDAISRCNFKLAQGVKPAGGGTVEMNLLRLQCWAARRSRRRPEATCRTVH